jgi:hypothetical protein
MFAPSVSKRTFSVAAIALAAVCIVYGSLYSQSLSSTWTSGLSAQQYFKHVLFLASDSLKGRGNGTPELKLASDYIANQLKSFGLKPAGDNGSYFQNFEITTGTTYGKRNALSIDNRKLTIDADFEPLSISPAAQLTGPLVFAGYGITAPDLQWDDYAGLDVKGKIVVVLRHDLPRHVHEQGHQCPAAWREGRALHDGSEQSSGRQGLHVRRHARDWRRKLRNCCAADHARFCCTAF